MTVHRGRLQLTTISDGRKQLVVSVTGEVTHEGKIWVSYCPSLDLSATGDTLDEVLSNTKEVIEIFFESCLRRNTLKKAIAELNWKKIEVRQIQDFTASAALFRRSPPITTVKVNHTAPQKKWNGEIKIAA